MFRFVKTSLKACLWSKLRTSFEFDLQIEFQNFELLQVGARVPRAVDPVGAERSQEGVTQAEGRQVHRQVIKNLKSFIVKAFIACIYLKKSKLLYLINFIPSISVVI